MSFADDAQFSLLNFEKFTVPVAKKIFGDAAQILSFEAHDSRVEEILDTLASCDGLIVDAENVVRFYASRVCRWRGYKTFTTRFERATGTKTEFAKICCEGIKPRWQFQTYVHEKSGKTLVGFAETVEIRRAIVAGKAALQENYLSDENKFYAVKFADVEGCRVFGVDAAGNVTEVAVKGEIEKAAS